MAKKREAAPADQDAEVSLTKSSDAPGGSATPSAGSPGEPDALPEEIKAALDDLDTQQDGAGLSGDDKGPADVKPALPDLRPVLGGVWKTIFKVVAARAGKRWEITDQEGAILADASGPVLDKYLPGVLDKCPELWGLGIVLGLVITPRLVPEPKAEGNGNGAKA